MENNAALGVKRSTVLWWKRCCDEGCTAVHNCDILPCSQLFAEMKDSVLPTFPLFLLQLPCAGLYGTHFSRCAHPQLGARGWSQV